MVLLATLMGRKWRGSCDADVTRARLPVRSRWFGKMAATALVEGSSGNDAVAEGLLDLLRPAIQQLDLHVNSVR